MIQIFYVGSGIVSETGCRSRPAAAMQLGEP